MCVSSEIISSIYVLYLDALFINNITMFYAIISECYWVRRNEIFIAELRRLYTISIFIMIVLLFI